jgi:hypothetical protein
MAYGAVLRSPFNGARAFLEWAVGLWPYVNGKALMNGVKLEELNSVDMIDILHYMFEEDMNVQSQEQMDAKTAVRDVIYKDFYSSYYPFGGARKTNSNLNAAGEPVYNFTDDIKPFDPEVSPIRKGYIPPTKFDPNSTKPFGNNLDSPLN